MPFFIWNQTNSGGSFVVDDKLTHRVVIEADNYEEAESKALFFGVYYNGVDHGHDCSCCGDRWCRGDEVELPADYSENVYSEKDYSIVGKKEIILNTVEEYCQHLTNKWGWESPDARIFYKDGTVKEFYKETNNGY